MCALDKSLYTSNTKDLGFYGLTTSLSIIKICMFVTSILLSPISLKIDCFTYFCPINVFTTCLSSFKKSHVCSQKKKISIAHKYQCPKRRYYYSFDEEICQIFSQCILQNRNVTFNLSIEMPIFFLYD